MAVTTAATIAALQAVNPATFTTVILEQFGRQGTFVWDGYSSRATQVAQDPAQGIWIASTVVSISSGAWRRAGVEGVYDVKWFGALGDGLTDDTAACQACINYLGVAAAGGTVFFSASAGPSYAVTGATSTYKISSPGLVVSTDYITLDGPGYEKCQIFSTATQIDLIILKGAARCSIRNLTLSHGGGAVVPQGLGSLVYMSSRINPYTSQQEFVSQCLIENVYMSGGWFCIRAENPPASIKLGVSNVRVRNCVLIYAVGGALTYLTAAGNVIFDGCTLDQDWPVAAATAFGGGSYPSAPAKFTPAVGDFVSTPSGRYLQCIGYRSGAPTTPLTAGAGPPNTGSTWYLVDILDGDIIWRIAGTVNSACILLDAGCTYFTVRDTDMTGAYTFGVHTVNNNSRYPADVVRISDCTLAGQTAIAIYFEFLARGIVDGNEIQSLFPAGTGVMPIGIFAGPNVNGELEISRNWIASYPGYGVYIAYASTSASNGGANIDNNHIYGMKYGIQVDANCNRFKITSNYMSDTTLFGANLNVIVVAPGTSGDFLIANNLVSGKPISNSGTGARQLVINNV